MQEFFTWEYVATFGGCTILTTVVTQFVKKIDWPWLKKIPVQVIAYIIAVIGLELGTFFTVGFSIQALLLGLLNAVLVTIAANGTYDNLQKALTKSDKE